MKRQNALLKGYLHLLNLLKSDVMINISVLNDFGDITYYDSNVNYNNKRTKIRNGDGSLSSVS